MLPKLLHLKLHIAAFAVITCATTPVRAEPMREFVLSATYGVVAGTLVGTASLAFSQNPGENLNRIARGASLGLYAGILLGLYIVYVVPSEDEQALETSAPSEEARSSALDLIRRVSLAPVLHPWESRWVGAVVTGEVLRF